MVKVYARALKIKLKLNPLRSYLRWLQKFLKLFQFFDAREYNTDAEASDLSSEDGEMEDAEDDRGSAESSDEDEDGQVGLYYFSSFETACLNEPRFIGEQVLVR